ncbi:hypothetical protein Vi05172_g1308 [Venturia inaequalis]|nr:hypothetical protein Vi05172_g1308 [Venturia inaequalis]
MADIDGCMLAELMRRLPLALAPSKYASRRIPPPAVDRESYVVYHDASSHSSCYTLLGPSYFAVKVGQEIAKLHRRSHIYPDILSTYSSCTLGPYD